MWTNEAALSVACVGGFYFAILIYLGDLYDR
jgi:hypothetical protein